VTAEAAVWAREDAVATGIGHGVALPHARIAGLKEPVVVVGLSEAGVDFDAPDGQPAHVIFLILTPTDDPSVQLDLAADIARAFVHEHALERVLRAQSYTEFLATLKTLNHA
jgi:mannitol/fructose-specific phosphotransferase system IIA component (Ntr-type)